MARHYSTQEALDIIMHSDCEDGSSSSSVDSEADTEEASESTEDASEVGTDQLESNSDSSETESGGELEEAAAGWTLQKCKVFWSPTNTETLRYVPAARSLIPGPTHYAVARISDPASSFVLLLTDDILQHIVSMTNLHGRRSIAEWRDMDTEELQAYVGLLILAGVYRSKNESTLSLWSEKSGRSIFRATMSHKRFHQISRTLRFDDKLSRPRRRDDKLAAFRKVWDMWTHRLPMLFSPFSDVCVDEQLVPFRGRCSFKQYMPKKPAKYGIKIWANCDVKSSYAWRLQVYTGKAAGSRPEVNQGMRVVLEMTEGLQGHIINCDNFFTSFALAKELLRRKLALVGTIRRNKPELPPILLQARARAVLSSTFAFTKTHTLVSYIPRRGRNVLLLSTKHRSPDVSDEMKRKPVIIKDYNRCKGGVDNLDKLGVVSTYSCRRRTNRWPLAPFHNLVDISHYNAYVLWTSIEPSWQQQKPYRRRLFIEEVGEMLVTPHIKKRGRLPRSSAAATMVSDLQGAAAGPSLISEWKSRRQCNFCMDRRVCSTCCKCGKFICKDHSLSICSPCST
ncbi:piggyBac transposable element-derived protein 4-like [Trematomus bernacchii]|uniref:piggyBac transposable element-derived protein 4-like n=1 Tax=Trematomus bernacchii TaxID=40690 RepID=UPI00146AF5AB|nr:piggyBac transposable element-derived protein 4-like [Trematomus bernacchii]